MKVINVANLVGLFLISAMIVGCGLSEESREGDLARSSSNASLLGGAANACVDQSDELLAGDYAVYANAFYAKIVYVYGKSTVRAYQLNGAGVIEKSLDNASYGSFWRCYPCHSESETHLPGMVATAAGKQGVILQRCANSSIIFLPNGSSTIEVHNKGAVVVSN